MTIFIQTVDGSFTPVSALSKLWVSQNSDATQPGWFVLGSIIGSSNAVTLKGPFATQAAAQTALTNAIPNLGGAT